MWHGITSDTNCKLLEWRMPAQRGYISLAHDGATGCRRTGGGCCVRRMHSPFGWQLVLALWEIVWHNCKADFVQCHCWRTESTEYSFRFGDLLSIWCGDGWQIKDYVFTSFFFSFHLCVDNFFFDIQSKCGYKNNNQIWTYLECERMYETLYIFLFWDTFL